MPTPTTSIRFEAHCQPSKTDRPFIACANDITKYMAQRFGIERHGLTLSGEGEYAVILNHLGDSPPLKTPKERTLGVTLEPLWSPWNFKPDVLNTHCCAVLTPFPWRFDNGVFGLCLNAPWVGDIDEAPPIKERELSIVVSPLHLDVRGTLYEFRHHLVREILKSNLDCDIYGDWLKTGSDSRLKGFIANKRDGIAPYRRSIVIENSIYPGYSTEKLTDCLICETQAIYLGDPVAPMVYGDAVVPLCRRDPIRHITELLKQHPPDAALKRARHLYRTRYNLIAQLAPILEKVAPNQHFDPEHPALKAAQ